MNEIQFIIYQLPDEDGKVQVVIKDETIWATQKAMAQLFDCTTDNIGLHLKNIFASNELDKDSVTEKISATAADGKNYLTSFYSLDDDKNAPTTRDFYAMIQNRFHYAITGQTAPEIIYTKADHQKPNMGLTTWKNAPDGRILKSDVTIAQNYLSENDIKRLERAVSGFFDYIEDLIENENTFNMSQFSESVNAFLTFRKFQILPNKGKISKAEADAKAENEYDIFNKTQPILSDFDKIINRLKGE